MLRCPTSEFPIWPAGKPTARPEASSVVHGASRKSSSKRGFCAWAMAFHSRSLRHPKPSSTMRMRKGRSDMRRENIRPRCEPLRRGGVLLALEDHADVVGCAGLEIDGSDAHQLPPVLTKPIELLGATRIH